MDTALNFISSFFEEVLGDRQEVEKMASELTFSFLVGEHVFFE